MGEFVYRKEGLCREEVPLSLLAEEVGTPLYVYSRRKIESNIDHIMSALSGTDCLVCYALKANANIEIVKLLAEKGCGADVVSGGELECALRSGIPAERIVFAGVGKTDAEITRAIERGILSIHAESEAEIRTIERIASDLNRKARIALRINPNIDARTHPYITTGLKKNKFGVSWESAERLFELAFSLPHLSVEGIHCHIGSMIREVDPFVGAARSLAKIMKRLEHKGLKLKSVDIGGGLGVDYEHIVEDGTNNTDHSESVPTPKALFDAVLPVFEPFRVRFLFEPGRYLVGEAGALVSRVILKKASSNGMYCVVDAGMNDFIRPSLYDAVHQIVTVNEPSKEREEVAVVGPICESTDFFSKQRSLSIMKQGDLIALMGTGAYGYALSSNYNGRPRGPEVLVEGSTYRLIRKRESIEDLWRSIP